MEWSFLSSQLCSDFAPSLHGGLRVKGKGKAGEVRDFLL